jgi:mannose-6-phosphate isomerase
MKLQRHFVEKPWGRGDIPSAFGAPAGQQIGEVWYEAPDGGQLPILVKWLFTSEKLSIQVHPDDAQARKRGLRSGKEECWVIVSSEPGAVIGLGTIHPLSPDELHEASLSGEIERLMDWKPVSAGDYFYIPAGTVHAIGAGITLVEVQQYADITYRLYDYGRPRELHLNDGVAVSVAQPYADPRSGAAQGNAQLVNSPHFRLWHLADETGLAALPEDGLRWVIPIEGAAVGQCQLLDPEQQATFQGRCLLAMS